MIVLSRWWGGRPDAMASLHHLVADPRRVYKERVSDEVRGTDMAPPGSAVVISSVDKAGRTQGPSLSVAGVFLGAVQEEGDSPIRLSRDVWTVREVEQLLAMARTGRELLGIPEVFVTDLEAPIQVDLDDGCGPMLLGKGSALSLEGLPTISEDAVLREPSGSTEASGPVEASPKAARPPRVPGVLSWPRGVLRVAAMGS
eukprot:Skav225092  [mRNA]  locus=scaffold621:115576:128469:+ [translate_table: standard]